MLTNAPKGTKDMMPDQAYKWHYIEEAFAEICRTYGFEEIRTPVFEHTELFQRGVGDTTDIVQKEMYSFQDYGKRNITLKPEGLHRWCGRMWNTRCSEDRSRPSFTITRRASAMRSRSQED